MNNLSLYTKLELLPEKMRQEVADFIDFLAAKSATSEKKAVPRFGSAKGKIKMSEDFDAPPDEFKDYM